LPTRPGHIALCNLGNVFMTSQLELAAQGRRVPHGSHEPRSALGQGRFVFLLGGNSGSFASATLGFAGRVSIFFGARELKSGTGGTPVPLLIPAKDRLSLSIFLRILL
jgi:hypothetical protein